MSKATINLYACGGTGINIASLLEKDMKVDRPGTANLVPIYIDTGKANLTVSHPDSRTYLIPELKREGSGKLRRANHPEIAACVPDILYKNKPADLNIVISSASGGSGSVIAPSIVGELLKGGHMVIVVAVGSTDSRIEVDNTINTILSYENISENVVELPIPLIYYQNTREQRRAQVNEKIKAEIIRLAILFSKQNKELDVSDLRHWLNYHIPTQGAYEPHLVALDVFLGTVTPPRNGTVISVATLSTDVDKVYAGMVVPYQATGFLDTDIAPELVLPETLHFALIDGYFPKVLADLREILKELDEQQHASFGRKSILPAGVKPTGNGVIL